MGRLRAWLLLCDHPDRMADASAWLSGHGG